MTDPRPLLAVSPGSPFLFVAADAQSAGSYLLGWLAAGLTARRVRGHKMRSMEGLFDEMAAALQFPYYFGENWPAFDECLSDLDWLPMDVGIAVLIFNAGDVLVDEEEIDFKILIRCMKTACKEFSQPIDLGESWDRPAVPFHVVLHALPAHAGRSVRDGRMPEP